MDPDIHSHSKGEVGEEEEDNVGDSDDDNDNGEIKDDDLPVMNKEDQTDR